MDLGACTVETGLLKKHPCGQKAVAKCANCEQALCAKHAVPQMSAGKKLFLCPECAKAWKQQAKTVGEVPPMPVGGAHPPKPAAAAPKPAAAAPKPAAAAPKPAAVPAAKPKEVPKEEAKHDDDAPLEFTPSKKPEDKK